MSLKKFENNIKSQYGEDGVIAEIFARIGAETKICVEFGAWDGTHLSNSWNLWHNFAWKAYLIEGEKEKADKLRSVVAPFENVCPIEAYVMPEGENSLDTILSKYNLPKNFDLLSIDIDGDDYYILQYLNQFRPRVIVIEFNPTVPPDVEMVQGKGEYLGASALSIIKLGETKGYKPIHVTAVNIFFVSNEVFDLGLFEMLDLNKSFITDYLVNVITSFDGIPFLTADLKYRFGVPIPNEPAPDVSFKSLLRKIISRRRKEPVKIPKLISSTPFTAINIFKRRDND